MCELNQAEQTEEGFIREALLDVCEEAGERELGVPLVGYVGISFFANLLLDCAPTIEEAQALIQEAIAEAEEAHDYP